MRASGTARRRRHSSAIPRRRNAAGGAQARSNAIEISGTVHWAHRLLRAFAELHDHAIREKVRIMAEHFHQNVAHRIKGRAKAMIVTRSRLHAIRYHRALERYVTEQGYDYGALVAFSGTVRDGDMEYTEAQLNGFPESQTKDAFERAENRFLVVANKFQTGFDQPLLHTMYVDRKLGGVNAVQTLSEGADGPALN